MALRRRGKPRLYTSGYSSAESALILLMNPPEGMPGGARPGEVTAVSICSSIHYGGMVSREGGRREVTSTLSLAPEFVVVASL